MNELKSAYERAVEYNKDQLDKSKAWGMSLGQTLAELYWELAEEHRLPLLEGLLINARRDKWGYEACRLVADHYLDSNQALPKPLADWVRQLLRGDASRPRANPASKGGRDMIIKMLVMVNVTEFGLNIDRNDGDDPFSAIDAVVEAASQTYSGPRELAYSNCARILYEQTPKEARDHWRRVRDAEPPLP